MVAHGQMTMRPRVVRLELERPFKKRQGLSHTFRHGHVCRNSAQQQIVGVEVLRPLALDAINFGGAQARFYSPDDRERDLVLQGKDVVKRAVVALGPEMRTGVRLNELTGDTHAIAGLAHATFEHIADAQLATDQFHISRSVLVNETRIARDYEKPLDARKPSDDVLYHAVTKIILIQITAHVLKWEHGDRRLHG